MIYQFQMVQPMFTFEFPVLAMLRSMHCLGRAHPFCRANLPWSCRPRALTSALDPKAVAAFAALEHKNWEKAVFAYDKGFGPLTRQCIPDLLNAVQCKPASKLLDVATGPGFVAEAAAKAGASVVAVDFSKNMLELAEKRLRMANVDVKLLEADAAAMPFEANSFDAVVCSFGVLHLPVPEDFFAESLRVLRPGGRLAFTVWAAIPATEAMALVHEAVQLHGNPNVPLPEGPPFFRFADISDTTSTLEAAGFGAMECKQVPMTWDLTEPAEAFVTFRDGTGRTAALLAGQNPDQLKAIEAHITQTTESKTCRFQMPCVLTMAQKP